MAVFASPDKFSAAQSFHSELAATLKQVPPYKYPLSDEDRRARNDVLAAITAVFVKAGGAVRVRGDGTMVRAFGIRASSTSSLEGACQNWISQFTLKAMAARN